VEDTEVPQLQPHAKKLTEDCRRFLNDLAQLLNSMKMWSNNDGCRSTQGEGEQKAAESHLRRALQQLELVSIATSRQISPEL
jgi:hypothetical protein